MAYASTMTARGIMPFANKPNDFTYEKVEYLQTAGSGATSGGLEIFADPAATDNFRLITLNISRADVTGSSYMDVYVGTSKIATLPTMAAASTDFNSICFGAVGYQGNVTTTTATVSLFITGGTCTVTWSAVGARKL